MDKLFMIRFNSKHMGVVWATRFEVEETKYIFYDDNETITAILNGITVAE